MSTLTSTAAPAKPVGRDNFPRWVLLLAGGILAFSLISVGLVRLTGNGPDQLAASTVAERMLRFEDGPNGSVAVIDGITGETVELLRGEQGFVRGVLRALARERRSRELGSQQPFRLTAHADGRVMLFDPATGSRVDLESFGPTNAAVFARYLPPPAAAPAARP
ncbi:MAG: photosynthetic complex assembly protein PuhC [Aquabacterium sp.]|nr:photosynthetic complex assembly protein PuhC [Aquabacterium sp.]